MANQEFFIQRPSINPTIYAYELVEVGTHKGYVKVGYTERDVETRVWEQMHTNTAFCSKNRLCALTALAFPTMTFTRFYLVVAFAV